MKSMFLASILLLAITAGAQTDRKFVKSKVGVERHLPFSSAVLADHTLYVAGTTAEPDKLRAGMSAEDEARAVMEQMKQTVESAGLRMQDLVSVQVFCTDLSLYDTFNTVYSKYFQDNFPARAFIGASTLLFNARFEVNGIAVEKH